ncbi:MAG: MFS transporter [Candidatus Competibacteraceae bacterium]
MSQPSPSSPLSPGEEERKPSAAPPSAWSPLRHTIFRWVWLAAIASNIGAWMHEVGAGWLMTSLSSDPFTVALVQAANAAPMFLLALPAGALSDIVDRRRYLLVLQAWMAGVALTLALLAWSGGITPASLLWLTLAMGIGSALMMPAWVALTPDLVPPDELPAAVVLSSVGFNISRAVGPALAGLIISATGPWATFLLNTLSFLGVIVVLWRWRPPPVERVLPSERFFGALRIGLSYARREPTLHALLIRALAFFLCASAGMALLPLLVRLELAGGAHLYGGLLAGVGAGAVGGAFVLPKLRERLSRDALVAGASLLYAAILVCLALVRSVPALALAMLVAGAAWIAVLSSLQVSAQTLAPAWVRARVLAVYMLTFFGAMAVGSGLWGAVASQAGLSTALLAAAAGLALFVPLSWRFKLARGEGIDLSPSLHWPAPITVETVAPDRGPVLITLEYEVEPADAAAFAEAMREVARIRRRNGALSWGLFNDTENPRKWLEFFIDESWVEHLRQHHRFTRADREIEAAARRFQVGGASPTIRHYLAPER